MWLAVAAAACGGKPIARLPQHAIRAALEPTVPATVITIQTTLQPQRKTVTHSIVIANGHARSDSELDRWRLFDLEGNAITYIDDLAKTYYTVPFKPEKSNLSIVQTPESRVIRGVQTTQYVIRMGGYQRELWIGMPPSVPPQLFGMMHEDLAEIRGFPLADHAELPYGKSKLVVDSSVIGIEQKNVPLSLLNLRDDYTNITAPGERRRPASSPRRDQSTPAAESQSSGTTRTAP